MKGKADGKAKGCGEVLQGGGLRSDKGHQPRQAGAPGRQMDDAGPSHGDRKQALRRDEEAGGVEIAPSSHRKGAEYASRV